MEGQGPVGTPWIRLWLPPGYVCTPWIRLWHPLDTSVVGTPWIRLCRMKKKEQYLLDVQHSTDKKLATTQDRQTLQNSDEKQYCQSWAPEGYFPGDTTRGFYLNFFREGSKVMKFDFSHSKLRKQPFLLKILTSRGCKPPF